MSDPLKTAARGAELDLYIRHHVLDGERFVCPRALQCRESHRGTFYEGQSHHVGAHYDVGVGGRRIGVVVTGQEYGGPPAHVSREMRTDMIVGWSGTRRRFVRDASHTARNPHMRGTTSLLRLLFGKGLGTDYEGEFIDLGAKRVHLFECFALVNFLLCSAVAGEPEEWVEGESKGGTRGHATPTMTRSCAVHYRRALEILEPSMLVAQGRGVRSWMRRVLDDAKPISSTLPLETVRVGTVTCLLATFAHPSAPSRDNWGMNAAQPYLLNVVKPTIDLARRIGMGLSTG